MITAPDLHAAVEADDLPAVAASLRAGSPVDARDARGWTPLMTAAVRGHAQAAKMLLVAGADPLAAEPRMGATALHKAAQGGSVDVASALLNHGAFVDQQTPSLGATALMDAVLHKHVPLVAALLERAARTALRNFAGQTARDIAEEDGSDAIIALIDAREASDAERSGGQLFDAVKKGDQTAVRGLIAAGEPLDERLPVVGSPDDAYTPLGIAVREGHLEIARLLLAHGVDPRRTIGLMRGTVLHEAAFFGRADLVDLLTTPRDGPMVEIDATGPYNGFTALHDAVWHGHAGAAEALVRAGARLDARTDAGLTARGLALLYGYDGIADMLAKAGAPDA